jgi:D-3-phosphoglycerate dehydrogenase
MEVTQTSFPRSKIKILLFESISESAVQGFKAAGYTDVTRLSGALTENDLVEAVKGVHVLGIRSKSHITEKVIANADKLLAVGAFCIGTNQIDLKTATRHGVAVFNSPYSNTRSVAELVIGACVMLIRRIPEKNSAAHAGGWMKDASGSHELRGKTIGIIGYGNIGSQVSVLAEAFGLKVVYHDVVTKLPLGNARAAESLEEVLAASDIVTFHVPSDASTHNMVNASTLSKIKEGAILINYSRGDVADLDAVAEALKSGRISGAAVDVFPVEPEKNGERFSSPLQNLPNVLLTPHIGGSTEEAQVNIGHDVTARLLGYIESGMSDGSLTVPPVTLPQQDGTHRILHVHHNVPGVLSAINSHISDLGLNIVGQYLKTNEEIGYVILDFDQKLSGEACEALRSVKGTIKTRIVY